MEYKKFDNNKSEDNMDRNQVIKKYQKQLKKLLKLPKVVQKSEEWYNIRKTLITASDFGQCLGVGKFGSVKDIYRKKCGYEEDEITFKAPMEWGNKYEDVACKIYEDLMDVKVHEFGLLKHPKHKFIGASPDGISENGIMLEIKCPWKRKNKQEIPDQYFYQIQGQLDVCDLEECDYIECYIKEYDYEEFIKDTEHEYKGIILKRDEGFIYGDVNDMKFYEKYFEEKENFTYWYLEEYYLTRVFRDKEFFKKIVNDLSEVWKKIEMYKNNEEEYNRDIKRKPVKFMFRKDFD
jgi:putative phage-type endonuclease